MEKITAPRIQYFDKVVIRAAFLGLVALVLNNGILRVFAPYFPVPLGNIFLFISAGAYGALGSFASVVIGALTEASASTGDYLNVIRLLILCTCIASVQKRYPQALPFLTTLALWVFIIGPAFLILSSKNPSLFPGKEREILALAFSDILMSLIAGMLLLSPSLWNLLTGQLKHVPLTSLLIYVMTSCSTLTLIGALLIPMWGDSSPLDAAISGGHFVGLIVLIVFGIGLPALLAYRLANIINRDYQNLLPSGLLPHKRLQTFSGLSSEYWRRQSLSDESKTVLTGVASGESSSSNINPGSQAGMPGVIPPEHGVCALNRNGTVTFLNRKFRRLAEVTTNDVIGKNIDSISMNATLAKSITELLESTFKKGPRSIEVKINQLPANLRFFEITSQRSDSVENSSLSDGPDSVIITVKDITDRRTVELHLLQAKKVESLGSIVSGIAHSFNNALTAITGHASYAKHTKDPVIIQQAIDDVIKSSQSAGLIVKQLLDFATSSPTTLRPENLSRVIKDRLEFFDKSVGEDFGITFESVSDSVPVLCDTNLLTQAFTNLILNSKESYANGSGKIIISLDIEHIDDEVSEVHVGARPGDFARIRFKDTGVGMSPETLSKAFDPLFTTKAGSGHTGLGLSIVFAIVRAHDGFLTVESHHDKGTTVTIYLPVTKETSDETRKSSSASDKQAPYIVEKKQSGRILLVEDEEHVREMVKLMLSSLGYEIESAGSGSEAVELAEKGKFDLLIADLIVPRMGGVEIVENVRKLIPKVPAIIMTGYAVTSLSLGPDVAVLQKPFDMETLAVTVKTALDQKK